MGNASVVASGVKAQGDAAAKELYTLVSLGGGGELVTLTKEAMGSADFSQLDQAIRRQVRPYLYNEGEGRNVPVAELVQIRNRDREKSIKLSQDRQKRAQELAVLDTLTRADRHSGHCRQGGGRKYREQCWKVDQRGTVGETILHLCLLRNTPVHYQLAKRLLKAFPKLVNDIYVGEEYYGETVLHLAIVNEDPALVKLLLDHGADVSIRTCGNFFCPEDQKDSRTDSLDSELVLVSPKTNYDGYIYLGEYPLSFAACLGQEECARLLLAKGADPNAADSNGNTALHMLVIHHCKISSQEMTMFELLVSSGARLDVKNHQGLTPLTLAAKLGRKDMYEHILEKEREVYWIFGTVTCAGYPIADIDTISATGEINQNSALNLIVYGEEESHLNMMDGLIVQLLQEKWKTFARFRFYRRFLLFVLYFSQLVTALALRPGQDLCATRNDSSPPLWGCSQRGPNRTVDPCYLLRPYRQEDVARLVLEVCVLCGSIIYLVVAMREIQHQGFRIFFSTLSGSHAPAKGLLLVCTVVVVLAVPGRALCAHRYEDVMAVLAMLGTAPYFLFFCRGFRTVGPFVVMIYNMIRGDLLRFFIIYSIFVIGFSQAFFIAFRGRGVVFSSWWDSPIALISMSVGDFDDLFDLFNQLPTPFSQLSKAIFVVYMIMVTLLLVNMLIAMMGNTFDLVTNTQKEWFRQWAKIVLMIELTVTPAKRTAEQIKYTQPVTGGKSRAFVVRWHQTEKEKKEIEKLRIQNKLHQRTLAQRKNALRILHSTRRLKTAANVLMTKSEGRQRRQCYVIDEEQEGTAATSVQQHHSNN